MGRTLVRTTEGLTANPCPMRASTFTSPLNGSWASWVGNTGRPVGTPLPRMRSSYTFVMAMTQDRDSGCATLGMATKPTSRNEPSSVPTTGFETTETLSALERRIEALQACNDPALLPEIDRLDTEAAAITEAEIDAILGPARERLVDALKRAKELAGDQW